MLENIRKSLTRAPEGKKLSDVRILIQPIDNPTQVQFRISQKWEVSRCLSSDNNITFPIRLGMDGRTIDNEIGLLSENLKNKASPSS